MMNYLLIKQLHMGLAFVSIAGFVLRWGWRMRGSGLSSLRIVRILPHILDTLFLGSAIILIFMTGQVPVSGVWLTAKITGLLMYILLGLVAMRTAPRLRQSLPAFLAALLVFVWVVSVARWKNPFGFVMLF